MLGFTGMFPIRNSIPEIDRPDANVDRRLHFYKKGETIPSLHDGVWQVCKGIVQLSTLYPNGEEGLLGWVGPSMCFGPWFTFLQTYQAKALSEVYLLCFSVSEIETSPYLCQQLLPQVNRRLRQMEAMLAIAGLRRVEDRINQLFLLLKQEVGQPVSEGTRLSIRLTHQDIAAAIGTSRVTVTRMLGDLKRRGGISLDSKRHIILQDAYFARVTEEALLRV